MTEAQKEETSTAELQKRSATQWAVAWRRFRRNKSALAGLGIVTAFVLFAVIGPFFAAYPPRSTECLLQGCAGQPPSWAHPFGTEISGVDVFSDSMWGARNDIWIGVAATAIAVAIGIVVGAIAGYSRGMFSSLMLGIIQFFFVIPTLLLILLFSRVFETLVLAGYGITFIILILGLFGWPGVAFVVRGEIFRVRELEFIEAEKALGSNSRRILFRHIVPNILTPIIVLASLDIAGNILTEVVLFFLGFGPPNTATWGELIEEGVEYVSVYPWVAIFPGILVVLLVFGFNLTGDGLADALNPRLRE